MYALLLLVACGPADLRVGGPDPAAEPPPAPAAAEPPDAVVDCAGAADFASIGEAVAAAESGDTIHVRPCTYAEDVDFRGKTLVIASTEGSADTVIEGVDGAVVRAVSGEGPGTTLRGFTLRGGGDGGEAAVYVDFSSLRVEESVLEESRAWVPVFGASADLVLVDVTMERNASNQGIQVYMSRGSLVATGLSLRCDYGGTGVYLGHGSGMIDRSTIEACSESVDWEHAVGHLQRSVVDGHVTVVSEDDHYDDYVNVVNSVLEDGISAQYGSLVVRNSVVGGRGLSLVDVYEATRIEGNVLTGVAGCAVSANTADFTVRNNVFWRNGSDACGALPAPVGAEGNLAADPLFNEEDSRD
ncbi:MAG: hypothetical protein ACK4YP_05975 [Myxococcota bacterium]